MVSSQSDQDDQPEIANNGSCSNDTHNLASHENSIPSDSRSPGTKGFGLKKWRRIRRDTPKDTPSASIDNSKILKRVLPANANTKPQHSPLPMKLGSTRNASDSRLIAGTDSENSEDRSSKSSTAASAPKNKVKTVASKNLGISNSKGMEEISKKARGEKVEMDKENSHSSIESDSRSSNLFFMHNNGKATASYDGEEGHQHFDDASQTKENAAGDSQHGSTDAKAINKHDPLLQSILTFQSLHESLVKEVQKLGEIGTEPILSLEKLMEDSRVVAEFADSGVQEPRMPSSQLGFDKTTPTAESSLQAKVLSLEQSVNLLECELDETRTLLVEKESKVAKLEAAIDSGKSWKGELGSTRALQASGNEELEHELEGLFKQRIEAEIEYLTITRATQSLKLVAEKQETLLKEQERVAKEQTLMLNKLGDAENQAAKLKKEAHELENQCSDILDTEEILVGQRRVCKFTWCFCTQFLLLILALWIFVSELSPKPGAVVPT